MKTFFEGHETEEAARVRAPLAIRDDCEIVCIPIRGII